jgi:hypothetical protein
MRTLLLFLCFSFSVLGSETEMKLSQLLEKVTELLNSSYTSQRFKALQAIKTITNNSNFIRTSFENLCLLHSLLIIFLTVDYINYFLENVEFIRSFLSIYEKPVILVGDNEKLVKEWLTYATLQNHTLKNESYIQINAFVNILCVLVSV